MANSAVERYRNALPLLIIVLSILVAYRKLTLMQGVVITDDIFTSDLMNNGFPYRFYLGQLIRNGELPTWYPPVFGGFPLLARAESGICYPPNLILFGLFPPYHALNLSILTTYILAAVGMYFFAKEIGANNPGAIIAGLGFAFCGFMVAHTKHLSMVNAASLFPLGLFFLERAMQIMKREYVSGVRWFLLFALIAALQYLTGHIQTAYYSSIFFLAYFAFRIPSAMSYEKNKTLRRRIHSIATSTHARWFVISMILAAGISAIQLIPTYELVSLSQRSGGVTYEYASSYAYDPSNIKTFFYPYANGDITDGSYRGKSVFWEDFGYAGLVAILLALYGVKSGWKSWHVKFFFLAGVGAFILVLGPNTPIYELVFNVVPGMKFFRFPTRFLFIVDASIAVLASIGATRLLENFRKKKDFSRQLGYALVAITILDLFYFQLRQNPIVDMDEWRATPETAPILQGDSSLFRIYSPGASDMHKRAFSQARGWSGSLQPYVEQRKFLQPSSHVLHGFSTADGYAQLTPGYVVDVWGDQNRGGLIYETARLQNNLFSTTQAFMNILSMNNIKYVLSPWPLGGGFMTPVDTVRGVYLFSNPTVLDRAYCVGGYVIGKTENERKQILRSQSFRPSDTVILEEPPTLSPDTGHNARAVIEQYSANEVRIRVRAERNTILVLSDTYYPGWKAFVDNSETTILKANHHQRAVCVPSGDHSVRFVFESSAIRWGAGVSAASVIILLGAAIRWRK